MKLLPLLVLATVGLDTFVATAAPLPSRPQDDPLFMTSSGGSNGEGDDWLDAASHSSHLQRRDPPAKPSAGPPPAPKIPDAYSATGGSGSADHPWPPPGYPKTQAPPSNLPDKDTLNGPGSKTRSDGSISKMSTVDRVFLATAVGVPAYMLVIKPEMDKRKKEKEQQQRQMQTGAIPAGMTPTGTYMPAGGATGGGNGLTHR